MEINWLECEFVESVEGRCGGQPTVVGTRVFPQPLFSSYERGETIEEIQENYPTTSCEQVKGLIEFARQARMKTAA